MAVVETYSCDICNTQKKDANHWWKAFLLKDQRGAIVGFVVLDWNASPITDPVLNSDRSELSVNKADAHLCGAEHLMKWITKKGLGE